MHIIQIPSAAPSFMGIWAIRSPLKIHCYTCMSFKTCWSRLIYTKLRSHRSFAHTGHLSLTRTLSWYVLYMSEDFRAFWSKNNPKKKKKRGKPRLNARKHWESDSMNRYLSAAVLNVQPSCNNSNLNDIVISLQRADSGSYQILVTGTKIFRIIWKLSVNC